MTGVQGPTAGQRQSSRAGGGVRKAWGATLILLVTPWAGCGDPAFGVFLCVAGPAGQGAPSLLGSVEEKVWFPQGIEIDLPIG